MINKELIKSGDLFLVDSNKGGPRLVKYFMRSPTLWHDLYRKLKGTQEIVPYYHVGMFLDKDKIIEQQWKVETRDSNKLLNTRNNLFIFRYKNATPEQISKCCILAKSDIGRIWDVPNAIGKFLTWLTGIIYFSRYIQIPKAEICVCRGAFWYRQAFGERFGVKTHSEITTQKMYNYVKSNPEKFEIVYES